MFRTLDKQSKLTLCFLLGYVVLASFAIWKHWFIYFLAAHPPFVLLIMIAIRLDGWYLKPWFWIKRFKQNIPSQAVVVLAGADWTKLLAWLKPNFVIDDVKAVVNFLQNSDKDFSIYLGPTFDQVEAIMRDKMVKEVYFVGHGGSHFFRLNTEEILCYSAFNDPVKYGKEFIHQVHCGTGYGKRLIDYVVPEGNRAKCFSFKTKINGYDIEPELHRLANLVQ